MNKAEIIRMAREAGFVDASFCRWSAYSDDLERFAVLVAAAEREAVLDLVDEYAKNNTDLRDAIRARGQA